ncbi:MAG: L,D-transpeptidase family protein [Actinomycetota bacterium]
MSVRPKLAAFFVAFTFAVTTSITFSGAFSGPAFARGPATALTLTASAPSVTFGGSITLTVVVAPPAAGLAVSILDASGSILASGATVANGTFTAHVEPDANLIAHASSSGVDSTPLSVGVRPIVTLQSGPVRLFDGVTVRGTFRPVRPGIGVTVELQHRGEIVATKRPRMDTRGRFHTAFRVPQAGSYRARAVLDATDLMPGRAATAPSVTPLPDLASGAHGVYVRLLERRLVELHYHLVGVDEVFDYRTADAVMAFRKVQRMARIASVDAAMWRALGSPKPFVPRNHESGFHIEVDQTRQMLATVQDGEVVAMIHVSTGKPSTPTHDGSFQVSSKLAGFSSKGLYYPSFFDGERAIHGWTDVPTYAASHGCVRVPYWVAQWIFGLDPVGTPVIIYT